LKRKPLFHDAVFSDAGFAGRYAREQRRVFKFMHPPILEALRAHGFRGGRILDAGCGPGYHAVGLKKAFPDADVTGIDLSDPLLSMAQDHLLDSGIAAGVSFQKGDVMNIPFPAAAFDAAICVFMFHLVPDPVLLGNELERVLTPGGQVVLIDLRRSWLLSLVEKEMRSSYTLAEALEVIKRSRLRISSTKQTPIWWAALR
jgi:ubiquinone/menaquinone biosynthesis C-methylase UbiE